MCNDTKTLNIPPFPSLTSSQNQFPSVNPNASETSFSNKSPPPELS